MTKANNPILRIVADTYAGQGTHDLQKGMCSGPASSAPPTRGGSPSTTTGTFRREACRIMAAGRT